MCVLPLIITRIPQTVFMRNTRNYYAHFLHIIRVFITRITHIITRNTQNYYAHLLRVLSVLITQNIYA